MGQRIADDIARQKAELEAGEGDEPEEDDDVPDENT